MRASYELWLTNDVGLRLAQMSTALGLSASKAVNKLGWFSLNLPVSFDINKLQPDYMLQLWRQPEGGVKSLWNVYFLRKFTYAMRGGKETILIEGPDMLDLMWRRIIAAYSGSVNAKMTDFGDDMMKQVVRDSQLNTIEPLPTAGTRLWNQFSVQNDLSLGPTIDKSFSFDYLLTDNSGGVLPTLSNMCKIAGTEVYYWIVPNVVSSSSITLQFRTYINQPGQDVSDRVVFNTKYGNLKNPILTFDYSKEKNYIYAGGQDVGAARNIQQVYDATRYNRSIWGRCEGFADARNNGSDDEVIDVANDKLKEGEPKVTFTADLVDTEGTRFGRDWDVGYKVKTQYRNIELVSMVSAVTIGVSKSGDNVQAKVDYQS